MVGWVSMLSISHLGISQVIEWQSNVVDPYYFPTYRHMGHYIISQVMGVTMVILISSSNDIHRNTISKKTIFDLAYHYSLVHKKISSF